MATPGVVGQPNTPPSLVQKVELRISCKNLPNKDLGSRSDPCAVLSLRQGEKYKEVGRTESLQNTLNPTFTQTITINYHFETVQYVRIRIYDVDNKTEKLKDDDFLGQIKCTLAQIVSNKTFTSVLLKKHKKPIPNCSLTVIAEEIRDNNLKVVFHLSAKDLDKKDFFGKSDPFLEMSSLRPDGSCHVVHRTEVVKNSLKPSWRSFTVDLQTLCAGDFSRPVKMTVYDMDKDGSHDFIGDVQTTMDEMLKAKDVNTVFVRHFSLLEYILGGLQFQLTVAIDFSLSNGKPNDRRCLHYINPEYPNEYMRAIQAVGTVLHDYDADKMIPSFGFGALIPPEMTPSHEFPLSFNLLNPYCTGVEGLLDAYTNCLHKIQLAEPCNVAPIIRHVMKMADDTFKEEQKGNGASKYHILLLLTAGIFWDMEDVRESIVVASGLPMSINILGMGLVDKREMDKLDGDRTRVYTGENYAAERDIVQFIPFRDFENSPRDVLTKQMLAEIPKQVSEYFSMRRLPPNNSPAFHGANVYPA